MKAKSTEIPTMHKSQLAGFIIDCQTDDIDQAASFRQGLRWLFSLPTILPDAT
jgi:hypothetical protein